MAMTPRDWRKAKKFTQVQVADHLSALVGADVSHDEVSRIENGKLPSKEIGQAYHQLTEGQVTAADFYELTGSAA